MKIENSDISLNSKNVSANYNIIQNRLKFWVGKNPKSKKDSETSDKTILPKIDILTITPKKIPKKIEKNNSSGDSSLDYKIELLKSMGKKLFGKDFDIKIANFSSQQQETSDIINQNDTNENWGLEYEHKEINYEYQSTDFTAKGTIKTADGKEVKFKLKLSMKYENYQESTISITAGNAIKKDPIILNFDGNANDLSSQKFDFDLDSNGDNEKIPYLNSGSGYLVIDKNNDGKINNGQELFGPKTGDGFQELSQLDSDNNGWIDESDNSFSKLGIWEKTSEGNDKISTLAQKNVEALYLKKANTDFNYKDDSGSNNAALVSSGLYIKNNLQPGLMKQVDIIV